ncbi:hypothetical protein U1Q18_023684 [Sarracenia purpurea var. burkii]
MSLENQTESFPGEAAESFREPKKHSKLSYTREFLLSLSELDVCKTFPSGFDPSVLSEFEDASHGIQDRQRIPSSLPFQSYRRTEYGSSPPTKGDSSNYSHGIYGKWDNRSSGRNERDSDSQSDWDSDTGRRHCNQTRRSWQSPEHDGLLGSGSFPRPSGYVAELSAPKVRSNDHYQLNRTNEPYHPPRPYKAVPHLRRGTNDSYNDETFGATECASQDKAEEERRRRESFELMRKDQKKALQEKNSLNPDKHKNGHIADIVDLLGDTKDGKRVFNRSNELDESLTQPISNNDSSKSSVQIPGSRPLVPPGFKSTILEKSSTTRPATHSNSAKVEATEIEESLVHSKAVVQNGTIDIQEVRQSAQKMGFREQQLEIMSIPIPSLNRGEQIVDSSADLEVSYKNLGVDNQLNRLSSLSEASETQDVSRSVEFDTKNVTGPKIIGNSKQDHSKAILEQLLGSASTVNLGESSAIVERHDAEGDGSWSPNTVPSSKFAHWFLEDEKKAALDPMKARPSDLLSLIVGGERSGTQVSDVKATKHIPPDFPIQSAGLTNRNLTSTMASSTIGFSEQEAVLPILTCKDLEQTILSEYSESSETLKAPVKGLSFSGPKTEESKADIDDRASRHLLSLLKKGSGLIDSADSPNLESGSLDKLQAFEGAIVGSSLDNSRQEKTENVHQSGRTLTLETLFGSAFMKELQSVEAPVSIQRGSGSSTRIDISEPHGLSFGVMGDALFPTSIVGIGSERSNQESNILQSKPDKVENWLGIKDTQVEVAPSNHQSAVLSKLSGFDVAVDVQLPEEESLITVGDPVNNTPNSMFMSTANSTKRQLLLSDKPLDISEKLAALSTVFKDERRMVGQEGPPFVHGPYDPMEADIPFRNFHAQPSSPHFQPPPMNRGRPFFHPLDSYPTHISSQMNFMAPEGIPGHDAPANQQFPTNLSRPSFHHPHTGPPAGYDLPHHSMLQQMQMSGNFPPPHLRQEFPRGALLPPHPNNHVTGFPRAQNTIHGLPFVHQQPNFGGSGMQLQAPDVSGGTNHPEAFQRLLEMELRANSMKIHPFGAASRGQGMRGHELDNRGFRYR